MCDCAVSLCVTVCVCVCACACVCVCVCVCVPVAPYAALELTEQFTERVTKTHAETSVGESALESRVTKDREELGEIWIVWSATITPPHGRATGDVMPRVGLPLREADIPGSLQVLPYFFFVFLPAPSTPKNW